MKYLIIALALLPAFPALSEPLSIAAGKPTGGYDTAAQRLSQRLSQRSIDSTVKNYAGSDEITLALCASKADSNYQSYEVRSFPSTGPNFDQSLLRKVQAANK